MTTLFASRSRRRPGILGMAALLVALFGASAQAQSRQPGAGDPYERYVQTSRDFRAVRQDKGWCLQAWPSWTYMPWAYRWTIGQTEASAAWAHEHGYHGAFLDGNTVGLDDANRARLAWIDRYGFRFYLDHAAGKGLLHLWDGDAVRDHRAELTRAGVRPVPLNEATRQVLRDKIRRNVEAVRGSPYRAAYALDDEASWGHFTYPTMWRVTDDEAAYPAWLREVYGPEAAPRRDHWATYEEIRPKLADWSLREFDASPLLDQWSFNDSTWSNFLGELVEFSNEVDPRTPSGIVGGQAPSPFGGYDYAKLMRKVQFIEAYDLGSSQAIIRSFNPGGAIPSVTTHFHKASDDDRWQVWYYLLHGNRGFIGWVDGWFDGERPRTWHDEVAPTYREASQKISPRLAGAEWIHDGVAIYYSHPSIQLGWILDAAAHGKTWPNRLNDNRLGASHLVRRAWEDMLRDSGVQANFLSYADVIRNGVPPEYKVLILPACLALSDAEARRIEAFCRAGGTVVADYLPGVWDQHGRGRANGGALDALFGVRHDPDLRARDLFRGNGLWTEVDQDAHYGDNTFAQLMTGGDACIRGPGGFARAVRAGEGSDRRVGAGRAVLLNLSPQRYNADRESGFVASASRATFLGPILDRCPPWVRLAGAGEAEHGHEIVAWRQGSRTIVGLVLNPGVLGDHLGGGNAAGLKTGAVPVTLKFAAPVHDVRDERTDRALGDGREFRLQWTRNEAIVLSFDGAPPRPAPTLGNPAD